MPRSQPATDPARTRQSIVDALRRYGSDSARLGQTFSGAHGLQPSDLQALVLIMAGEAAGQPATPSALRRELGLSAGGTSLIIDRLEQAGHVRRHRDHPDDNRVVHLRYTDQGIATGRAFFGPLAERTDRVMDQFTPRELTVISRFLDAVAATLHEHVSDLSQARPASGS